VDGIIVDHFYVGFYDLIKRDLHNVIKESQSSGKVFGSFNSTFLALIPKKRSLLWGF
jgi:hypothetical protein